MWPDPRSSDTTLVSKRYIGVRQTRWIYAGAFRLALEA
jgi:hypothetical protein